MKQDAPMPITPTNMSRAAAMTGLSQVSIIRTDDLAELKVATSRLAEFMDRMDWLDQIDLAELPPIKLKPFGDR